MSDWELASQIHKPAHQDTAESAADLTHMIVEFITAYPSHSIIQIYEMPSQMFFTYYKKITTTMAIKRVEYIEAQLLAEAKKWADKGNKHKVDREYNKLIKIAEGKNG